VALGKNLINLVNFLFSELSCDVKSVQDLFAEVGGAISAKEIVQRCMSEGSCLRLTVVFCVMD